MKTLSKKLSKAIGSILGINWDKTSLDEFHAGINVEMEHGSKFGDTTNVTKNDLFKTGKIALAHLMEIPDYYTRLKKMESDALDEGIALDIDVGDVVLGGKFKNKRVIVKTIGTDDLGQPTINGKSLLKFRIEKKLPKEKQSKETRDLAKEALVRVIESELGAFLSEKVNVVQRERSPEYDTAFLQELSERIARAVLGPEASTIKFKVEMRAGLSGYAEKHGALGSHEGKRKGWYIIHVKRPETYSSLKGTAETIAHEMTHAIQTESGRLQTHYKGWTWEGKPWDSDSDHGSRPWEQEAVAAEELAGQVLEQMKSEGKIQQSKSAKMRKDLYGDSPTMGDLDALSPEEFVEFMTNFRKNKDK